MITIALLIALAVLAAVFVLPLLLGGSVLLLVLGDVALAAGIIWVIIKIFDRKE